MNSGQWRFSSQLLHLSAVLPPNFIHTTQQHHPCARQSLVSCKVFRGLVYIYSISRWNWMLHQINFKKSKVLSSLSVQTALALSHLTLSGLPPSVAVPYRYTSLWNCTQCWTTVLVEVCSDPACFTYPLWQVSLIHICQDDPRHCSN